MVCTCSENPNLVQTSIVSSLCMVSLFCPCPWIYSQCNSQSHLLRPEITLCTNLQRIVQKLPILLRIKAKVPRLYGLWHFPGLTSYALALNQTLPCSPQHATPQSLCIGCSFAENILPPGGIYVAHSLTSKSSYKFHLIRGLPYCWSQHPMP